MADSRDPILPAAGYSTVLLQKRSDTPTGLCEARGMGVFVTKDVDSGSGRLENAAPRDPGPRGGFRNPTEARDTAPPRPAPEPHEYEYEGHRTPQVRELSDGKSVLDLPADGTGVRWRADCADDVRGYAAAANPALAGAQGAGSVTSAKIDRRSGRYVATSRAYVAGLRTPSGVLDVVSSVVQVRHLPGGEPAVSYRIGTTGGVLASGSDVPAADLVAQFNGSVRQNAAAVAFLGPFGLTLMGPTVGTAENGVTSALYAPFLELGGGLAARKGAYGEHGYVRLVNVAYEGVYRH